MLGIEMLIPVIYGFAAIFTAVIAALVVYVRLNKDLPYELLNEMQDVPKEHKDLAASSFRQAEKNSKFIWLYDMSAPVVMLFVLPFVKREAEHLPNLFRKWDNEVSINGDGTVVLRDGEWVRVHGNSREGEKVYSYSDMDYVGDSYYCEGHHPRSFYARYVWLGWRNRASKSSEDAGVELTENDRLDTETSGWHPSKSVEGIVLIRSGRHYQLMATKKIGPFCRRTNYGFKLNNSLKYNRTRAMVVTIAVSLPLWKK